MIQHRMLLLFFIVGSCTQRWAGEGYSLLCSVATVPQLIHGRSLVYNSFPSPLLPSLPLPSPPLRFLLVLFTTVYLHNVRITTHHYPLQYSTLACTTTPLHHLSPTLPTACLPTCRFEDALADFSEALRLVPSMACAHVNIGLVHFKQFCNPER